MLVQSQADPAKAPHGTSVGMALDSLDTLSSSSSSSRAFPSASSPPPRPAALSTCSVLAAITVTIPAKISAAPTRSFHDSLSPFTKYVAMPTKRGSRLAVDVAKYEEKAEGSVDGHRACALGPGLREGGEVPLTSLTVPPAEC